MIGFRVPAPLQHSRACAHDSPLQHVERCTTWPRILPKLYCIRARPRPEAASAKIALEAHLPGPETAS